MIGNDIVDLRLAAVQSNWKRKGFLEKVFLSNELEIISGAGDPDMVVWLLWSMKEAAYKAHQQKFNLRRRLNWKMLECSLSGFSEEKISGVVKVGKEIYFTASEFSSEAVHTSALIRPDLPFKNGIFRGTSEMMKTRFFRIISEELNYPAAEISVQKNEHGIPFLEHKNQKISRAFSFTGHGNFSAFSLALMNS